MPVVRVWLVDGIASTTLHCIASIGGEADNSVEQLFETGSLFVSLFLIIFLQNTAFAVL
ncbi:MAG: hypothetical protein IJ191_06010 [Treponema sp.]|nr:hypothetical protein [Treponema sp.]